MAENEKIVLGVAVDASGVKPALDGVARDAGAMAQKVTAAGKNAGAGLEQIGVSAGKSAQQTGRELRSITSQIQRAQIDIATAGKSASEALQIKANIKGIDIGTLKPQLDALKAVEAAQNGYSGAMQKTGMSAAAMSNALRNVPAQFTDIAVSLQGGQKPLTVLLQQGGQLKDLFGGIAPAARALGSYVLGLVNPLTLAAAGVAAFGFAMVKANSSLSASNGIAVQLAATGRGADLTREQFSALTKELALLPGVSKDASKAILAEFTKTREIGGGLFRELGLSVADFAAATGTTAPEAAKVLAQAFADPAKGAKELEAALGSLTSAQLLTIEGMTKVGNTAGAQAVLMEALKESTKGLANEAMTPLGRAVDDLGNAWGTMLGKIGRSDVLNGANNIFAAMIRNAAELTRKLAAMRLPEWLEKGFSGGLNGMVFGALGSGGQQQGVTGTWTMPVDETDNQVKTVLELTKGYKTQASAMADVRKQGDLVRESLKALRAEGKGNSIQAKELEDRLAGVNEKLVSMAKKAAGPQALTTGETEVAGIRAKVIETQRYIDTMKAQGLEAAKQTEGEKLVVKIQQELLGSLKGVARANKEKALSAAQSLAAVQKESGAMEALLKSQQEFDKSRDKEIAGQQVEVQKLEEKALAMEDQVRMYGLGKEAIEALSIARLQERADILAGFPGSEQQVALIEQEIDARKRLAVATDRIDGLDAGVKAAKAADAEWKRTATSIENTMTDALMRAFEGGKSFAQALRDTVVNMFKTMVLRPVVSAVMSPISAAIGGSLGLSGAANAATGGNGLLSGLGSLGSLASGAGILGAGGLGLQAGFGALMTGGFAGISAAVSGGLAAIGAGTGASIAAGLGVIAGALGPIALGIGVAYSLLSGKRDSRFGGTYGYNTGTGATDYLHGPVQGSNGEDGVKQAITGTVAGINNLLKAAGSTASLSAYRAGLETSEKGRGGVMSGGTLSSGATFGESGQGSNYNGTYYERTSTQSPDGATAAANFALDLKQSIVQALQAANDLPEVIASLVRGVDAEALTDAAVSSLLSTIDAVVVGVNGFRTVVADLPFAYLKDMSFQAAAGLIAAAGGLDALGGKLSGFYDNFYTDAEKAANTRQNIAKTLTAAGLGISADDLAKMTRPEFRKWYEDVATQLGAENPMAVALLNVAGAFAAVTPVIDAVANAKAGLIDAYKAEATAMQSTIDKFRGFASDLRSFRDSLLTGSLSPLTPAQRYAQTSSTFDQTVAATRTGTEAERAVALARLQADAQALLEASRVTNASGGAYMQDFDRVREALSMAAISAASTADVATLQLDAAKSQLTALGEIDRGVYDVGQAITALALAQQAAGTAGAVEPPLLMRAYASAAGNGNAELVAEIRALRDEVTELRRQQSQETGALAQATAQAGVNTANSIIDANSRRDYQQAPALA